MNETRSSILRRRIALFCVALCLTLCAQVAMAIQDRLQHAFLIDHAPSMIAGMIDHGHDDHHAHDSAAPNGHGHELPGDEYPADEFSGDSKSLAHHHHGGSVFAPWIVSAPIFVVAHDIALANVPPRLIAHPDAATWRRERPPKRHLEILA